MALSRRSIRHRPATTPTIGSPRLLPTADTPTGRRTRAGDGAASRWSFAVRARALRLSPPMVEQDLRDLGVNIPPMRLQRIMIGIEPAAPDVLAALVNVLHLHDLSLGDEQVVTAGTAAWLAAGHRIPPRVVEILANTRSLSTQQILATAARAHGHHP